MTTEAMGHPHATMSHPWGTSPITAIVHGVMGVHQTAPTWSEFMVKPRLGSLQFANITVPTIRGPIVVHAKADWLSVDMPCNTRAMLCVQHDKSESWSESMALLLDGKEVSASAGDHHICSTS